MTSTYVDVPVVLFDEATDTAGDQCPDGHEWCLGEDCGEGYHSSDIAWSAAQRWKKTFIETGPEEFRVEVAWEPVRVSMNVYRDNTETGGDDTEPMIALIADDFAAEVKFSAAQARRQAAIFLNLADRADPLPLGVMVTAPELIHLGDEMFTDDGWQQVTGVMAFAGDDTIRIFTPERDPDGGDGWEIDAMELVQIRRRIHGSCAIQFVEPFPAVGGTK